MLPGRDVWMHEVIAAADPHCPAEPMEAEHPLCILYSSGSTAKPKGIMHTTGGYLTGVSATHRYVFDLDPERCWRCVIPTTSEHPANQGRSVPRGRPRSCS